MQMRGLKKHQYKTNELFLGCRHAQNSQMGSSGRETTGAGEAVVEPLGAGATLDFSSVRGARCRPPPPAPQSDNTGLGPGVINPEV